MASLPFFSLLTPIIHKRGLEMTIAILTVTSNISYLYCSLNPQVISWYNVINQSLANKCLKEQAPIL